MSKTIRCPSCNWVATKTTTTVKITKDKDRGRRYRVCCNCGLKFATVELTISEFDYLQICKRIVFGLSNEIQVNNEIRLNTARKLG